MSLCVKFTGVRGLGSTGLAVHNGQSGAVNLVQFVAVTAGLVEEEHLGFCAVADAKLHKWFLIGK